MDSWTRVYLGSLFVVLGLLGVSPAQDAEESLEALSDDIEVSIEEVNIETASEADQATIDDLDEEVVYMVRLRDDGMLHGRVQMADPTGKNVPVDAQVHFKQAGEMVDSVATDDEGAFEVAGLSPGDYVATAEVDSGATDFSVTVLPYEEGADPKQMMLDATLSPTPELEAIPQDETVIDDAVCANCGGVVSEGDVYCESCADEVPYDEGLVYDDAIPMDLGCGGAVSSCGGGFAGGCGGGCGCSRGRGLGWLLGAAGLAVGITALADDCCDDPVVSPFHPIH